MGMNETPLQAPDPLVVYMSFLVPLMKRAGLAGKGLTYHALRHTFATALLSRGEHPKVVQSLVGHSSITQTMDTYSHLLEGMGSGAVDGLHEAFG